jgi:hypothetical protein
MNKYLFRVTEPNKKRGTMIFYATQFATTLETATEGLRSRFGSEATWELKEETPLGTFPASESRRQFPIPERSDIWLRRGGR